jgi:hypothetical protein
VDTALGVDDAVLPESLLELDPKLLVAVVVVVVIAVVVVVAAALRDSTGSWPLASVTVISSHVATNTATAPPAIRRRSIRARARRAAFSCVPLFSMPVASSASIANA